tara:strand:+ start:261 stop:434 length:174 start_codon:yes stop_codon:yes gene_type:complete
MNNQITQKIKQPWYPEILSVESQIDKQTEWIGTLSLIVAKSEKRIEELENQIKTLTS